MCHISVIEFIKQLTGSKIGTQIAFQSDILPTIPLSLSILRAIQKLSSFLHLKWISILYFASEAIGKGKCLQLQQTLISESLTNRVPHQPWETLWVSVTLISFNHTLYSYFLVKKSLAAFALFQGHYQELALSPQMLSVQMLLQHRLFVAYELVTPSMWPSYTSYLAYRCSRQCPCSPVALVGHASCTSAENWQCGTVQIWRLYP